MRSDLDDSPTEGENGKKTSAQILREEVSEGMAALEGSAAKLFISGLAAGLEVGLSLVMIAVVRAAAEGTMAKPLEELLLASMYSFGFIIVVLGRSELFTEQTSLAVLLLLNGNATLMQVLRLWGIVYVANLIGAMAIAAFLSWVLPALGRADREVLAKIGTEVVDHPSWVMFTSGILAGWMMGLLSWLVAAGRDTISQVVIVWLITAGIGLAHLHHSILGAVEVFAAMFAGGAITPLDCGRFLLAATLGNALGGSFFVALIKSGHSRTFDT